MVFFLPLLAGLAIPSIISAFAPPPPSPITTLTVGKPTSTFGGKITLGKLEEKGIKPLTIVLILAGITGIIVVIAVVASKSMKRGKK